MPQAPPFIFRPRVRALDQALNGEQLLLALGGLRGVVLLDSAAGQPRHFSLIGFEPLEGISLPRCLAELESYCASLVPAEGCEPVPGPFQGGFMGALAYDLGVTGEELDLPVEPGLRDPILGGLYTDFVVTDHQAGKSYLVLGEEPGDGRPSVEERAARVATLMAEPRTPSTWEPLGPLVRHTPAPIHQERIRIAQAEIAAGEYYQANLAHRMTRTIGADPVNLYLALRRWNPAPYMGYLGSEHLSLLSSSPELLMECSAGKLRSRPIKGTLPRGRTPVEDRANAKELLASEKDRAELAMIVDLVRNDCSRVAQVGSVRVGPLPELESHASVLHLAADVSADLAEGRTAFDALAALFPGGSISGAPKLRSMEAIARLEGEGRGFFTGSLGFLDCAGNGLFNILIRTLVARPQGPESTQEVTFWVGGGITAASDPVAEERETRVKGARLAAALEGGATPSEALGLSLDGDEMVPRHPFC
ncbi:MAG: anthranilate synthase component I family protein [Planctomycetota bacterium]|nr:anthranilate synthase component I family protein [Planctomycetota bacterium]